MKAADLVDCEGISLATYNTESAHHSANIRRFSAEVFVCKNSRALALLVQVGLAANDMSDAVFSKHVSVPSV